MAVYVIGDVQGCYDQLMRLLKKIAFDPARDKLWFAGDLVNRGPHSLKVLRFVKGLGNRAVTVLGNHDLHLLAISEGNIKHKGRDHTLDDIIKAKDREELLMWLRHQPLMHYSRKYNISLVHAGLPQQWDIPTALQMAGEVEKILQGKGFHDYCQKMYGNEPCLWSKSLKGMNRYRFITNCFTRLRYCDAGGRLALKYKGPPGSQNPKVIPWFMAPGRASRHDKILFGHWSTLGYREENNTWSLDTGCLWGGRLTALKLQDKKRPKPFSLKFPNIRNP